MTIEVSIKVKDEKTSHTEKDVLQLPLMISKDNKELVEKVARAYSNFATSQTDALPEAPEITLKFKMIWQL